MFTDRLKSARKSIGLSQQSLAKKLFITQQAYAQYETGRSTPNPEMIKKIANCLNVSSDYLLGVQKQSSNKGIWINVLGKVAAGIPLEAIEDIIDQEEITAEMAAKGECFGLQIHGSSMEPRFTEGDTIIVLKQNDVESGEIAVVLVNGEDATCKKIMKHKDGISLISTNPLFAPMYFTNKEVEELPVVVLGKVIELRAKF